MKRKTVMPSTNRGASGPVLAVCEGHRCGGPPAALTDAIIGHVRPIRTIEPGI